jgi:phosphate transport system permease protein
VNRRTLRKLRGNIMVGLVGTAVLLALLPLIFILVNLVLKGAGSLSLDFFTKMPAPAGETGGGVMHAIVGTLIMVGLASAMGMPIGIGAGIFCAEYPGNRIAWISRFVADVMNGTPSIVVGVFAWTWIVATQKHFSAFAGSVGARDVDDSDGDAHHRGDDQAGAQLAPRGRPRPGLSPVAHQPRHRPAHHAPGIVTGSLLAVARVAGETAPLLFTALGSQYLVLNPSQPMAALPLTVFTYATGPYEQWHQFAWAAALVLIIVVLVLSIGARLATRRRFSATG